MSDIATIEPAFAALDACSGALATLDANCCEPGRSPRMAQLAATLAEAKAELKSIAMTPGRDGAAALDALEEAGAQVGRLQVGCCAPDRLPLYAEILENLVTAQLTLGRALRG